MPHADLVTRAELPRFGVASGFLSQFDVRPIQVTADTAGALGSAAFKWRFLGETSWSPPVTSSTLAPWSWSPSDSFSVLTFGAGTYATTAIYTVDESGAVTRSGSGPDTVTATRFDMVANAVSTATEQLVDLLQPRCTLPLLGWGAWLKQACADVAKYILKSAVGMSAGEASVGDANIRLRYDDAIASAKRVGTGERKPPDIVDSSSGGKGAGLMVGIASNEKAGF